MRGLMIAFFMLVKPNYESNCVGRPCVMLQNTHKFIFANLNVHVRMYM